MRLYPAVGMKNRQCVRLGRGAFKDITIYSDTPEKVATHWQERGASFLHLVNLDGALAGYSANEEVMRRIADTVSIPIEINSGVRSGEAVERMLGLGVRRVVIETRAVEHPEFLRGMVRTFSGGAVVTGVDTKDGMVAMEGWEKVNSLTTRNPCLTMREYDVRHAVYTDVSRGGMLSGPSMEATREPTEEAGLDIIVFGGVSCMEGLECLRGAGIRGAIIDKTLYENRVDLAGAARLYEA